MDKIKNVQLIVRDTTLTITFSGSVNSYKTALPIICKDYGLEYIGNRVEEDRSMVTLVRFADKLYFLHDESACGTTSYKDYSMLFLRYADDLESTNPISDYKYCIEYCNPFAKDKHSIQYYFKSDEFKEAKKLQQELGPELAFLKTI